MSLKIPINEQTKSLPDTLTAGLTVPTAGSEGWCGLQPPPHTRLLEERARCGTPQHEIGVCSPWEG